jgi:hypothetical protein
MATSSVGQNHRPTGQALDTQLGGLCRETQGRAMIAAIVNREVDDAMRLGQRPSCRFSDRTHRYQLAHVNGDAVNG